MNRILPKVSIIQTTFLKVTLSIFVFVVTFFFLLGGNFWEKESIRLNYELLNTAHEVESKIQSQINVYERLEENDPITNEQRARIVNETIRPLLTQSDTYSVVYYDIELGLLVYNDNELNLSVNEVLSAIEKDNGIREMKLDMTNLINVPVYQGGILRGYIWAYATNSDFTLESFLKISLFAIHALGFLTLIMFLVRKYMKQIEDSLDHFSQMIVNHNSEFDSSVEKLPELKPVFDKITSHTEALEGMNRELELSKLKIVQIMEGISDGFFSLDKNWIFTFVNQETEGFFNRSDKELLGKTIFEVFPQFKETLAFQKIQEARANNEAIHWESDGDIVANKFYDCHAYPFDEGLTFFFRDVTELKQQQRDFARLEKLNLIGQLAAGISHEIRNPLTTVKGFIQLLGLKSKYAEEKGHLDLMISEIDRANSIITDFLSLAKSDLDSTKSQNINGIILKIFPMLQADAYSNNKEVVLDLNTVPDLLLNENEIRQLLLNLVRNGLEVSPEHGSVIIQTYEEEEKAVLAIIDQGGGIPDEVQEKIGTPFLTTKETGTGLGLPISIGIARRHNADLKFETGKSGTIFKIVFNLG